MTDLPDWMATMHSRAVQSRSPVQTAIQAPAIPYRNAPRNRPPPRQMRPAEQRAMDPNAGVRRQAMGQLERRSAVDLATMPRVPRGNQFAEAGGMALEFTGLPQVRRGAETLGDVAQAPYQPNAPMRALSGAGELGLGVLGAATFGEVGAMRPRPTAPPRSPARPPQTTRLYRGIVPDEGRRSALGDRWWSTDPRVASSYAPEGADGAHVLMGDVDENAARIANIEAPPGTMFRSIPVETLPPEIRRAFPRSTRTVSTHEIAAAAESMGYQGVSFKGIRDSGYGADVRAPGASGGDPGRVVALFDDTLARSPFPTPPDPSPPLTRPPTQIAPNGMPIRPPQPFRNSLRGGNDDLAEAAGMRPTQTPDAGQSGAGNDDWVTIGYRGLTQPFDGEVRPAQSGLHGPGVYINDSPDIAGVHGEYVYPVQVRRNAAFGSDFVSASRERGDVGFRMGRDRVIFDPANMRMGERYAPNAPDVGNAGGGNAYIDTLRAEGFDTDNLYYHGGPAGIENFQVSAKGEFGPGTYITRNRALAEHYANGGEVYPVYVRGSLQPMTKEEFYRSPNRSGGAGIYRSDVDPIAINTDQGVVFDPTNVRHAAPRPNAPARGNTTPKPSDGQAMQAPTLGPTGPDRNLGRGIFGPQQRPGIRDMQPEGIYASQSRRIPIGKHGVMQIEQAPRGADDVNSVRSVEWGWKDKDGMGRMDAEFAPQSRREIANTFDEAATALRREITRSFPARYRFDPASNGHARRYSRDLQRLIKGTGYRLVDGGDVAKYGFEIEPTAEAYARYLLPRTSLAGAGLGGGYAAIRNK